MNSGTRQQAYDRGHTIFSPDGRLYQVEYAREAVERGAPSLGVQTSEGVVLAARKPIRSPLLESDTIEKVHRIDDHVAIASAGHAADARQLVEFAREWAQRHRLRYGEPVGVQSLAKTIADHVQEYTQTGGSRPYGTALLVAGVDDPDRARANTSRLFEIDPSGTPYGWRAVAIGNGSDEIRRRLEERLEPSGTKSEWGNSTEREHGEHQRNYEREHGEHDEHDEHEREHRRETDATDSRSADLDPDVDGDKMMGEVGETKPLETIDQGIETALDALETTADEALTIPEIDVYTVRQPKTDSRRERVSRVSNERLTDALDAGDPNGPAS